MINSKRFYKYISVISVIITIALMTNLLMPSYTMAQGDSILISRNENTLEIKTKISALNVNKSMLYVIKAENLEIPATPEAMENFANNHVNEIKGIITETEQTFTYNVDESGKYYAVVLLIQDKEIEDAEGNKVTSGVYTSARSASYVVKYEEEKVEENKTDENKTADNKTEENKEVKKEVKQEDKKEESKPEETKQEKIKPQEEKQQEAAKSEQGSKEQKQEQPVVPFMDNRVKQAQPENNTDDTLNINLQNQTNAGNKDDKYDDYIELEETTAPKSEEPAKTEEVKLNKIKAILNAPIQVEKEERSENKEEVKSENKEENKEQNKVEQKNETKQDVQPEVKQENKVEEKKEEVKTEVKNQPEIKKEESKTENKTENITNILNKEEKAESNNKKTLDEKLEDVHNFDSPEKLPQTGDDKTGIMFAIAFFSLLSIVSFIKYRLS